MGEKLQEGILGFDREVFLNYLAKKFDLVKTLRSNP